jgi:hypothetical protein
MTRWIPMMVAALLAVPAAAELYKWVDADGKVHYTDTPPPANAKKTERKKLTDKPATPAVSYALQQAMKNFPVTLYSYACGDACSQATALLAKRGVPHAARDPMLDQQARADMKKVTDGEEVAPVLIIGRRTLKGFNQTVWNAALDEAGYPSTVVGPVPVVAAPKPKPAPATATPEEAPASEEPASEQN